MRSLRLKLIVASLLVLGAVILSFDLSIFIAKRNAFLDVLDLRLFAQTQSVARGIEIVGGKPAFDATQDDGVRHAVSSPFRIVDNNGTVVFQSPRSTKFPWPPVTNKPATVKRATVHSTGGKAWRIATWVDQVEIDPPSGEKKAIRAKTTIAVAIQCAESLGETNEELGELASLLAVLSLATFLVAGSGSFFLAGWALRPIQRINQALADVSETRLDRRIDREGFDSELHPLIDQLNAALSRLEKGFQRERQFTADASHELRTPLAAILNTIEVLLRRPRAEHELIEAHRDTWRAARSMQSVIEGLLLLARMDAGKAQPAKEKFLLAELVGVIFDAIGSEAETRTVRVAQAIDPGLRLTADPAQIRLALSNLIDNAVRYNRPDGSVTVEAWTVDGGTVIEVKNTGIGIPAEHLPRIFERFYRVDPSRAEATGGSGLGLSIVRKIVEAHDGHVTATSSPEGAVITVFLPAS